MDYLAHMQTLPYLPFLRSTITQDVPYILKIGDNWEFPSGLTTLSCSFRHRRLLTVKMFARTKATALYSYMQIRDGDRTEWSPIRSVTIQVITKSDDRAAGVGFWLQTELDDTKSYYQLIIKNTMSKKRIANLWEKGKFAIKYTDKFRMSLWTEKSDGSPCLSKYTGKCCKRWIRLGRRWWSFLHLR